MRKQTPPDLKWLLVERATVAGDIARLETKQALLAKEIAKRLTTLQALDTTIHLRESRVTPDAAGVIRSHAKEYGKRGALKEYIVATLKAAPTDAMSTRAIALVVAAHFGLEFVTRAEFSSFIENSVRPQVALLRDQGFVEILYPHEKRGHPGMWKWKADLPTLAEITAEAAANS